MQNESRCSADRPLWYAVQRTHSLVFAEEIGAGQRDDLMVDLLLLCFIKKVREVLCDVRRARAAVVFFCSLVLPLCSLVFLRGCYDFNTNSYRI